METIKFRAWDGTRMESQVDLYFMDGEIIAIGGYQCQSSDSYKRREIDEGITVMQFTGLTDKNGVEIYEGDILGWTWYGTGRGDGTPTCDAVIWYEAGRWGLKSETGTSFGPTLCAVALVIGNVFTAPDLLTKIKKRESRDELKNLSK